MPISKIQQSSIADSAVHGHRNLVINGDMRIDQRNLTVTPTTAGEYTLDRYRAFDGGDGSFTVSQTNECPTGFQHSLKIDVTGADTAIAADAYKLIYYGFEGQNMAHLKWGTSEAQDLKISFWVRSSTTGDFSIGFRGNQTSPSTVYSSIHKLYNISQADTWEHKTVTIPGDNTNNITYFTDQNLWSWLIFGFSVGSDYTAASNGVWEQANKVCAQNSVNLFSSASNDWYLTGLQVEVGDFTPFEHRPVEEELVRCERYYQLGPTTNSNYFVSTEYNNGNHWCTWDFRTVMRDTPDITATYANTPSASDVNVSSRGVTWRWATSAQYALNPVADAEL